jgi:hypothetical protein
MRTTSLATEFDFEYLARTGELLEVYRSNSTGGSNTGLLEDALGGLHGSAQRAISNPTGRTVDNRRQQGA